MIEQFFVTNQFSIDIKSCFCRYRMLFTLFGTNQKVFIPRDQEIVKCGKTILLTHADWTVFV